MYLSLFLFLLPAPHL
uniref:Uncharacterized protein n=1 Tax=Arundo donax TaxID=35708 RepID=A0A0A9EIX5_ARUDO